MLESKDHLCTLLITFSDWDNANKEMTTAHTFASTDPAHYPQQRRVVHSRQIMGAAEVRNGEVAPLVSSGAVIERVSHSALSVPSGANFGSDMVQFRQMAHSPPVLSVPLATSVHQSSAGRLINSLHAENPTEESNGRLSGQLKHSPTVGSAATSPLASSSTIGVHEVSLSYVRPNSFSPSAVDDRRSLPTYLSSPPARSSAFFPSGSVHMHFSAGKAEDARLLYTIGRPEAEWTFGAGESIQISDSGTKKHEAFPATIGSTMTAKSTQETTTMKQPRGMGQMEHTARRGEEGAQKQTSQQQQPTMRRGRGESEQRVPPSSSMFGGPSSPQSQPFGASSPQFRPGPVLSHHQTRSYESNEESKMSEEKGKGKSRTVFEKTTCELLTEKSVTTYGRWQNAKSTAAAEQPKRTKESQQRQPISTGDQQRRGLPRTHFEETNGTYLYTRYGEDGEKTEGRRQTEVRGEEGRGGESRGTEESAELQRINGGRREWEGKVMEERLAVEEEMRRWKTKNWKKTPEGRWSTDERLAKPLVVSLSERPFRRKTPEQMATAAQLQGTRLIDFETYKREVEQLQQQAAAMGRAENGGKAGPKQMAGPMAPAVVVGPGHKKEIVLPKAKQPTLEATLKYFASEELTTDQQQRSKEKNEEKKGREKKEEERRRKEKEEQTFRMWEEKRKVEEERRRRIEREEEGRRMEEEKSRRIEEERIKMEEEKLIKRKLEEEKRRRIEREEEEERIRMEEEKLIMMRDEKRRRLEEEQMNRLREEEQRRKEEEVYKIRMWEEKRKVEEERRRRIEREKEDEEGRRMEEEKRRIERMEEEELRRKEDEKWIRMEELKRTERPSVIRPQPIYVSTSSEFHQISEVFQERIIKSPPPAESLELPKEKVEEIRSLSSPRQVIIERSVPVQGKGKEERAEEIGEKMRDKGKGEKEEKRDGGDIPTEFELDTSRGLGRHLLETLSRELQYQEEVDTEISKRRRRVGEDGREMPEGEEEQRMKEEEKGRERDEERGKEQRMGEEEKGRTKDEEEEQRMREEEKRKTEEQRMREEEERRRREEMRRTTPIEEEEEHELLETEQMETTQQQHEQKKAFAMPLFVPIHRSDAKVSLSGELSLPPVREEGEDEEEEETSFEQKEVETSSTATSQTLPASSRKRLPPPPPPKPPHSLFGTNSTPTTIAAHPSEPHFRESSFSSVYSNFPQTLSTLHTYNTMEPPSVASSDYRSAISSRPYFSRPRPLSPTRYSSDGGGTRVLKMVSESSSISSRPLSPYPASTTATAIRDAREREKKEMSELNDRLATYIEKVRFLEAQNRKLATDLDFLHKRWGKDASNVREMYETDLRQAKKLLEETQRQKDELEKKANAMEEEMDALKKKNADAVTAHEGDKKLMEELLQSLSSLEAELAMLKRRLEILDEDLKALRRENQHLNGEMQKAWTDLDQETLNRIDYQNQVQTLLEEIDFLRRAHDSEIQDLQAMASRDTTGENREFFRNELASAIREIRNDYDVLNNRNRSDIESWYKMKVQEIQTMSARQNLEQNYAKEEVKRLRTQLGDLRGKLADLEGRNSLLERQAEELAYQVEDDQRAYESALNDKDTQIRKLRDEAQALMLELQMLLDTKQTLDAEIAIYRKMLEGEEDRSGLYQLVEQVVKTQNIRRQDEAESQRILRGEKSSRQSYQRSAKGNVSILETSPEGKYVVLENTHRSKEEPIGEWKLKRRIDGKREIVYTFPQEFVLRPGKSVKIWAQREGINAPPDQLVFDGEESFGTGSNVQTLLYNRDGEERASLIQRSSGR
ncbi:hypothetical protein niasHT_019770 [Heterodera trifolii]|uniref:Intermediate filament protein n=1 Tax=Heterodera trifolii TaxID=157864 RepID=A0ABD2LCH6_9BILA